MLQFWHFWHQNTRKLCSLDKKCIEFDLCILIRQTILYSVIISLWSILTKIFAKNMYFTCLFLPFLSSPRGHIFGSKLKCCIGKNRACQDLSNDILLNSIDHHGLAPQPVEITPQPKVGKLWRPKTPLKWRFSVMWQDDLKVRKHVLLQHIVI